MLIGEEGAVAELWEGAARRMPQPREDRPGQPVYVIDEPPEPGETGLRPATRDDFDAARCRPAPRRTLEELGIDPLERDPAGFRWRTRGQIEEGRSWLWREGDTILFKAEASAWTPTRGAAPAGLGRPASARNRGYAKQGMRDLCRRLLEPRAARLPVRPARERAGDPRLRGDRHAADDQLPEPDLRVRRRSSCSLLGLVFARWLALELASFAGHRLLPPGPPPVDSPRQPGPDARPARHVRPHPSEGGGASGRAAADGSPRAATRAVCGSLLALALAATASGCGSALGADFCSSCSATDRAFISTAQVNMANLGTWTQEYQSGDADQVRPDRRGEERREVPRADAAERPSLQRTRRLMGSMLVEYRKAIGRATARPTRASTCTAPTGSRASPATCSSRRLPRSSSAAATSSRCSSRRGVGVVGSARASRAPSARRPRRPPRARALRRQRVADADRARRLDLAHERRPRPRARAGAA